jgi:hypothetical protein
VGPYFMGSVEKPSEEAPKKSQDDGDDEVIDVLNYPGPKK